MDQPSRKRIFWCPYGPFGPYFTVGLLVFFLPFHGIQEVGGLGMLRFFCSKCVG